MALPHIGSWGLPEFGLTERVSDFFGQGRTSTGGSNLQGNQSQTTLVPSGTNSFGQPQFAPSGGSGAYGISQNTGQTLGANTSYAPPASSPQPTGTGSREDIFRSMYGPNETMPPGWNPPGSSGSVDPFSQIRNQINSGYSNYFAQLDSMMNDLPSERSAQEGIVGSQYQQGQSDLSTQKTLAERDLARNRTDVEQSKSKNLKDLSENMRNLFMSGNVYLGSRGAGDSSAANQYSYALTKVGSKERNKINLNAQDQFGQIADREFKLNTVYDNEVNRLTSEKDQKMFEVSQWFSDAQKSLKLMLAQGELNKSSDLQSLSTQALNYAMTQAQNAQTIYQNKKSALEQWALNNSTDISSLKNNLQAISTFAPMLSQFSGLNAGIQTAPSNTGSAPIGFGFGSNSSDNEWWKV